MTTPICPVCGAYMKQLRRGATLARRGPIYLCPVDDSETTIDERGNLRRPRCNTRPGAHGRLRSCRHAPLTLRR